MASMVWPALHDVRHVGAGRRRRGEAGDAASAAAPRAARLNRTLRRIPKAPSASSADRRFLTPHFAGCHTLSSGSNGRRQKPRRRRHRGELDQGRAAQGDPQEAAGRPLRVRAAAAADHHRRPRHERRRRHRGARSKIFHDDEDPAAGRRHRRLRPVRHRPQDHRPDDDRRGARRADPLGGGAAHPVRHQGHVDRLRGPPPRPEAGQMDLLLVAAKKDEINDYAAILREAKLKPVVVDINAFTVQNIFEHQYGLPPDGTIALLNVGAAVSSLNIVSKGVSAFTREITNAGNSITEEIRKQRWRARTSRPRPTSAAAARRRSCRRRSTRSSTRRARRSPARSSARSTSTSRRAASRRSAASTSPAAARTSRRSCQAIEKRARVPVQLFDPMVNLARRHQVRQRAAAPRRWRRRWSSRSASRFAATRSAGNGPHKPSARQAAGRRRRRGGAAEPTQTLAPRRRRRRSSSTIVACLFVQKMKQDELAAIAGARTHGSQGADRRHQEADRRPRRDQGAAQGAARPRGRHPEAPGRAHRARRRRSSSSRTSSRRAAGRRPTATSSSS